MKKLKLRGIIANTYQELGNKLGLSKQRVHQIINRKIKRSGNMMIIANYSYNIDLYFHLIKCLPKEILFQKKRDRLLVLKPIFSHYKIM